MYYSCWSCLERHKFGNPFTSMMAFYAHPHWVLCSYVHPLCVSFASFRYWHRSSVANRTLLEQFWRLLVNLVSQESLVITGKISVFWLILGNMFRHDILTQQAGFDSRWLKSSFIPVPYMNRYCQTVLCSWFKQIYQNFHSLLKILAHHPQMDSP